MSASWLPNNANLLHFAAVAWWVAVALLLYVYAGYPLLLAALALFSRRRRPEPGCLPTLSLLIAAHNEEAGIEKKLEQTLTLDYPPDKMEILVLSDGSTDRTDAIVESFTDPRVRLVRVEPRLGKTHAQNFGARRARGEILVFSDATTVYHPQALRYLACNYQEPRVGAVSGRYQYFDPEGDSPTGLGTVAFWNYENWIKTLQSRIQTISGCCGCIYSVRRSLYTELAPEIISDLVQPLWVIQKGYRVVFEDRALAYEQTTQSTAEEFSMRVRVVTRGMRGLLSVPDLFQPWKHPWVCFQLVSHKVLRWLVPVFLFVLLAASTAQADRPFYFYAFLLQVAFYQAALLSVRFPLHRRWKLLGIPLYFCTLNAAALLSLIELLRGRKYAIWQPVRNKSR
ncbi:MAG: glycosyltransferase family 2 protein [Acidobacteria bacterium]|nr:MAG: glycosyltransferase family 2 protein [Acidobacteriota bacterium]